MVLLSLALAALIGISLGLLGGGGSILTVPVFVYVLGMDAKPAIAMSLAVVGATSLVGALRHWRAGNTNVRIAMLFGVVAMIGTFAGTRFAAMVSGSVQMILFAIVMLLASVSMFRSGRRDAMPFTSVERPINIGAVALVALPVGVLTGLVGVGGGFLIVPALVLLTRLPMKQAVGTSLLVIAMNSFVGFAGYLDQVEVQWAFVGVFTAVAITGILAGTHLVQYVSQSALKRAFAVFLLFMSMFIFYMQ